MKKDDLISKIPYEPPVIKKLNPNGNKGKQSIRTGQTQGPPSIPGPAATSPSTPGATVF